MAARCCTQASRTGWPASGSSSITLMNEQPSNPSTANHSPNVSKIASSLPPGVCARCSTAAWSQACVHSSSRRSRNARISSSLEAKLR